MIRLKDIFGQEGVIGNLRGAMSAQRLGHGLIFAGPEGVGKATCRGGVAGFFFARIRNRTMRAGNARVAGACRRGCIRIIT